MSFENKVDQQTDNVNGSIKISFTNAWEVVVPHSRILFCWHYERNLIILRGPKFLLVQFWHWRLSLNYATNLKQCIHNCEEGYVSCYVTTTKTKYAVQFGYIGYYDNVTTNQSKTQGNEL